MDENTTPGQPGQVPPEPPAPAEPPAPDQPLQPRIDPGEPPAVAPPPPPQPPSAPQATQAPPPAQPYAQTPPPAQPAAPPAKKKPTAIILIIVAVVLGLCALTACGFGALALLGANNAEDTITEADEYYDSALATIDEIDLLYDEVLTAIDVGDPEQGQTVSAQALLLVEDARGDVLESRVLNDSLDSSTYKTEYTAALDQLDLCVDSFEQLYILLPQEGELYNELDGWWDELGAADDTLDQCYVLIDNEEYSAAKGQALDAMDTYDAAAVYFAELDAQFPGHELDKQVKIEELLGEIAGELVAWCEAAEAEDWDTADEHVEAHDAADAAYEAAEWPSWNEDWTLLFSSDAMYDEAIVYYDASIDAWNRSADAYNAGDY